MAGVLISRPDLATRHATRYNLDMHATTKFSPIGGPLKYHGGKTYLAKRIVALMPPHRNYVEPFFGGGAVLLAKNPEGVSEVVNDLDGDLTNFWSVLQCETSFAAFLRRVEATPFSEVEWAWTGAGKDAPAGPTPRAVEFFVACRQSLAGRGDQFAPISTARTRRGMNEQVSAWLSAVEGLSAVHARLKRVLILNRDAVKVIEQFDKPDTVMYLDPPYLPDTRTSPDVYRHEMTADQHNVMLRTLIEMKHAKVLLSGYPNELYESWLTGWRRETFDVANFAAGGTEKRRMTECVWMNFDPPTLPTERAA